MTVRARLFLTWFLVAAVLASPAVYAVSRLVALRDIANELRTQHARAFAALGQLQTSLARLERFQANYVATTDPSQLAEMTMALRSSRIHLSDLAAAGYQDLAGGFAVLLDSLESTSDTLEQLVQTGRAEEATSRLVSEIRPLHTRTYIVLDSIAERVDERSLAEVAEAYRISDAATRAVVFALVAALAIALAIAVNTTTALTSPLRRVRSAMAEVAAGSFESPESLPYVRRDEIGDLARSFRAMTEKLAELDRVKAEFVSVASHELKTPLNVIAGYADLLSQDVYGPVSERQRPVLDTIREQTHAVARQVDQLLSISRIEAGGLSIEPTRLDLAELFGRVERAFQPLARQKGVDLGVELDDPLPAEVWGDPDRLANEVLGNLLSNALKFTPPGGTIRLRAYGTRSAVHLEVADTGVGIPGDQLPYIFEKYYQVGRNARSMGTGLGLAIAREVVAAHGGTITATSEPGHGTTFHITLPARPRAGEREREPASEPAPELAE